MTPDELRQWRRQRDLSQVALAKNLGISVRNIHNWEEGHRAVPPLLPLALETVARRLAEKSA